MKIIDLSKPIQYNKQDPWFMKVKIKHKPHRKAKWLLRFLGLPFGLFPKKFEGWADDTIKNMGVHSTTHIDAPWHYSPTTNGEKSKTIDEVPLDWCYGEGVVIDMKHKKDFDPITVSDIDKFLQKNDLTLKPGMIVLVKTGRDKINGTKDFHKKGTGMTAQATEWLIDSGIKVMGIDSWGWDLPLPYMIKKAKESKNSEYFWEAHLVGQNKEYCHMEQLVNLDALPLSGFKVAVFPLKIVGASAAPARVVAMLD
ncbi:cyclase family protein [Tenacibaculum maritimum]|uniref:cyclase family protein n=1 Tax=Tenacibaculum maritimum TaxID=107401 RepID=UPI0012E5462A|nr:cyclase family protein [Tenacibaculum maritimum]MCD9562928.1 cyclase family protein [Tenacibaculum maritimum]MCD9566387.1 cyclase family protein [Tenacibaculum maritimum]MCD9579711.1 cyclase family protein [Tenacibaculum maritimum]MCD9597944.1 cyclase family protein [Tenacibaculum maritimum]MCD9614176.1 cyclase family protein [Tenacibaculum maritimum]